MSICLRCGKYPFCNGIEENKKECDKFIKRKLGGEDGKRNVYRDNGTYINNRANINGEIQYI